MDVEISAAKSRPTGHVSETPLHTAAMQAVAGALEADADEERHIVHNKAGRVLTRKKSIAVRTRPVTMRQNSLLPGETLRKQKKFYNFKRLRYVLMAADVFDDALEESEDEVQRKIEFRRQKTLLLQEAQQQEAWYAEHTSQDVAEKLKVNLETGLTSEQANKRLAKFGKNQLTKPPPPSFLILLLEQFADAIVIMLLVAAIVSLSLGEIIEALAIILIVVANAVVGVLQESKASAALDALESLTSPKAMVLRNGRLMQIDSVDLVPGDVVEVAPGSSIPGDMRLIDTQQLQVVEMALTGEPDGVAKDANFLANNAAAAAGGGHGGEAKLTSENMAFNGTSVSDGRGRGIIIGTGMDTRMGKIADLMINADPGMTPLQLKLHSLGLKLAFGALLICCIVFVVGVTTERGTDPHSDQAVWLQIMLVAVGLAVAAVPEGLPAAVTISLALGMQELVDRGAIVRNLHSVETLGSASVICTDKTGTITKGQMTTRCVWTAPGVAVNVTGKGFVPVGSFYEDGQNVDEDDANAVEQSQQSLIARGSAHEVLLALASLCSNAQVSQEKDEETGEMVWEAVGNSSECPIVVACQKAGNNADDVRAKFPRLKEVPFSSARKMMSVCVDASGNQALLSDDHASGKRYDGFFSDPNVKAFSVVKGAPNYVLRNCTKWTNADGDAVPLSEDERQHLLETVVDGYSARALRVLAIGYKTFDHIPDDPSADDLEKDIVLIGFIASIDPERDEVIGAIAKCHHAAIRVVMITGDYVKTAEAIAKNVGLIPRDAPPGKAIDCAIVRELGDQINELEERERTALGGEWTEEDEDKLEQLWLKVDEITNFSDVYARAKPADKITIVRSLQRQGNVCSMTGDGVNDAPSLKQADIGVAMGTGTDVAKAASEMVLTNDDFNSIVAAIEQGRVIYSNIHKFVSFLLSTNVAEIFIIFLSICIGLQTPLEPIQLLWMNLVTDGPPALALAMEKGHPSIMNEPPRPKDEPLVEKTMKFSICVQAFMLTFAVLTVYIITLSDQTGS